MKRLLVLLLISLAGWLPAYGVEMQKPVIPENMKGITKIKTGKALGARDVPVRVARVEFREVDLNGEKHLAAGVVFTKEIDSSTVQQNSNIRLLRQENGFWVDAATQGNVVRIMQNSISWLSGASLQSGAYRMHLRGTIKDIDGLYLDCNNDGVGEGGKLPAYDSVVYTAVVGEPGDNNSGMLELIPQSQ